ncbi:hypothetical protein [Marinovum sp.]|uniref:hypothetical protein n=1 Tax=Marinovum sp. TaxID=2024839 RepID=UPI003A935EA9
MLAAFAEATRLRRWFEAPPTFWELACALIRRLSKARMLNVALAFSALIYRIGQYVAHHLARPCRELVNANTRASITPTMILIPEAPIRIKGYAGLELTEGLLADLSGLYFDASHTQESRSDRRIFSATLIDAVTRYIRLQRAVLSALGESAAHQLRSKVTTATVLALAAGPGLFTDGGFNFDITPVSKSLRHL